MTWVVCELTLYPSLLLNRIPTPNQAQLALPRCLVAALRTIFSQKAACSSSPSSCCPKLRRLATIFVVGKFSSSMAINHEIIDCNMLMPSAAVAQGDM